MMLSEAKEPPGSEKPSTIAQKSRSLRLAGNDCASRGGPATNRNASATTTARRKILKSSSPHTGPLRGFYTAETRKKRPHDTLAVMLLQDPATLARPGAEPIPPTSQTQPAPTM